MTRGSRLAAAAVCLGLCVVAATLGSTAVDVATRGSAASTSRAAGTSLVAAEAAFPPSTSPTSPPVALRVPSLGISAALVRLGLNPDGSLEVPADAATPGWFSGGPPPGAAGPAVLAGHVDSAAGPGVFADLQDVAVGADVEVESQDGSTTRFVVTAVQQVAKDEFPTDRVYGPVAGPELRLITCGGVFDDATGHYDDNVVVFAREV